MRRFPMRNEWEDNWLSYCLHAYGENPLDLPAEFREKAWADFQEVNERYLYVLGTSADTLDAVLAALAGAGAGWLEAQLPTREFVLLTDTPLLNLEGRELRYCAGRVAAQDLLARGGSFGGSWLADEPAAV